MSSTSKPKRPIATSCSSSVAARREGERGAAILELSLVLPMLISLLLMAAEIGMLLESRLIVTNVSREGGSIASRLVTIDDRFLNLLASAGRPLDLTGPDGRIVVTRITSGDSEDQSQPRIVGTWSGGRLSVAGNIGEHRENLGLTPAVHNRLVYNAANGTADIAEVTIVEVHYKHRPFTPFQSWMGDLVLADGDGTILSSQAVF